MRIIAGSKAGISLLGPRDFTTRPITDRVKESLFGILDCQLSYAGITIADLFCGTGSLGLEALSRGARCAFMVDSDADALARLHRNIAKLDFADRTTIIRADVFRCPIPTADIAPRRDDAHEPQFRPCGLVFVDPPYRCSRETSLQSRLGMLLTRLDGQLPDSALIVVRHSTEVALLAAYGNCCLYDRREYGNMTLSFLEKSLDREKA